MNYTSIYTLLYSYRKQHSFAKYFALFIIKNKNSLVKSTSKNKFLRLRQQFKARSPCLLMWTLPFSISSTDSQKLNQTEQEEVKAVIQKADELFESNKYEETSALLLPYKESKDVEVLWRLSRALYNQAQSNAKSEADKRLLIQEAYTAITKALDQTNTHWAVHKWMSVLLDAHSAYDGIKARITQLECVKDHMLRAVELNPNDATTLYMLGSWCYQIADMPWFQRKIASTIFAAPPTSSFEEALQFFSKAEEIDPRFYSQNLLMLGKTFLKLEKQEEAAYYLTLAKEYPSSTEEDKLVQKEAAEILSRLTPKENK